jgi:hypothetical protein
VRLVGEPVAALHVTISVVVSDSALHQMLRIDARRIVTGVHDAEPVTRQTAMSVDPYQAVSKLDNGTEATHLHDPVSSLVSVAFPLDAIAHAGRATQL